MMIASEALGASLPCQSFRETERVSLTQSAKAPASTRRRSGIARCQAFVLHHVMTGGAGGLVQRTRCRVDTGLASQDARSSSSRGGEGGGLVQRPGVE